MIIHKAANAFKSIRSKNKAKIRTVKTNKSLVMKELKKGIHSAIQRFIRGDPLSDEEDEPIENYEAPSPKNQEVFLEDSEVVRQFFIKIADF